MKSLKNKIEAYSFSTKDKCLVCLLLSLVWIFLLSLITPSANYSIFFLPYFSYISYRVFKLME